MLGAQPAPGLAWRAQAHRQGHTGRVAPGLACQIADSRCVRRLRGGGGARLLRGGARLRVLLLEGGVSLRREGEAGEGEDSLSAAQLCSVFFSGAASSLEGREVCEESTGWLLARAPPPCLPSGSSLLAGTWPKRLKLRGARGAHGVRGHMVLVPAA